MRISRNNERRLPSSVLSTCEQQKHSLLNWGGGQAKAQWVQLYLVASPKGNCCAKLNIRKLEEWRGNNCATISIQGEFYE